MYEQFPEVMNMLWARMLRDNKKNWRRVYKVCLNTVATSHKHTCPISHKALKALKLQNEILRTRPELFSNEPSVNIYVNCFVLVCTDNNNIFVIVYNTNTVP